MRVSSSNGAMKTGRISACRRMDECVRPKNRLELRDRIDLGNFIEIKHSPLFFTISRMIVPAFDELSE